MSTRTACQVKHVYITTGQEEPRTYGDSGHWTESQETCRLGRVSSTYPCDSDHKHLRGLRHTQSSMNYSLRSPVTKQAKRPRPLCHHRLARQVLHGQDLVKCKGMRSLILAGADRGHCPYLSVLSQPEGRGWKPRGQHAVLWSLP